MTDDYNLSITGATLRRPDTLATACLYLELGDWVEVRRRIVTDNLYQLNSEASLKRFAGDIIGRLRNLSDDEIAFLVNP